MRLALSGASGLSRVYSVSGASGLLLLSVAAHGWNADGHRVVALTAFDLLQPGKAGRLVEILHAHPRFDEDFIALMPGDLEDGVEKNRWIVAHAATWPDIARRFDHAGLFQREQLARRYNRGRWHYVNYPVYLDPGDVGWAPDPGHQPGQENVVAALVDTHAALAAGGEASGDLALRYCWLLHLVADVHQPLHAAALYDRKRFPRGDRGGNDIAAGPDENLHYLWDRLLDADGILRGKARVTTEFAPETWARESFELAEQHAYDEAMLRAIRANRSTYVDAAYRTRARTVALPRTRAAALRLAAALDALL
ncbi:MAG: S1/P1 nuclease [Gammaproteobacteria bacterium]|nr:S1/P1 nuclease [Gammaproteobacteria bacterium]